MENEQTQKYQNFISAENFPEDPKKYQNQNFISEFCHRNTTPPGAILTTVFICRSFAFCMTKRLSPQVEVKSRKTNENGISHIQETALIHHTKKSLTLKPIFTQDISEKLLKDGEHKSPPRHTFMWRLA